MIAYQISVNGTRVATDGLRQGVVSAIANWVFIPSDLAKDPEKDWHAGFSLAALDDLTSEHLKWFRYDFQIGDEISIKLVETNDIDEPTEREPRKKKPTSHSTCTVKSKTENADLSGSEFLNTNLSAAQFRDVRLAEAQFVDVNLAGAHFEDVALTRAVIRNANCSHLTIEDACYEGMCIDGILVSELLRVYRSQQAPS